MLIHKITYGWVTQVFDTVRDQYVAQAFTAADDVNYETPNGEGIALEQEDELEVAMNAYLPFDMVQPSVPIVSEPYDSTRISAHIATLQREQAAEVQHVILAYWRAESFTRRDPVTGEDQPYENDAEWATVCDSIAGEIDWSRAHDVIQAAIDRFQAGA
jgi:hypothetical protein